MSEHQLGIMDLGETIGIKAPTQHELELMTVDEHAEQIRRIRDTVRKVTLSGAIQIGRHLAAVKELLPHGEWTQWLMDNVSYSERTAQQAMALAAEYGTLSTELLDRMSYTSAVAMIGLTGDERTQIMDSLPEDASTREVKDAVRKLKETKALLQQQLELPEDATDGDIETAIQRLRDDKDGLRRQLEEAEDTYRSTVAQDHEQLQAYKSKAAQDHDQLRAELDKAKKDLEKAKKQIKESAKSADKLQKEQDGRKEAERAAEEMAKQLEETRREREQLRQQLEEVTAAEAKTAVVYQDNPELLEKIERLQSLQGATKAVTIISYCRRTILEQLGNLRTALADVNEGKRLDIAREVLARIEAEVDAIRKELGV